MLVSALLMELPVFTVASLQLPSSDVILFSGPRTRNKAAPDINSEEYFPSLSASKSVDNTGAWGRRSVKSNITFKFEFKLPMNLKS